MASTLFFFLLCSTYYFSVSFSKVMLLPLTHSLSKTQFNSTPNLLKFSSLRSTARFHHHRRHRHRHRHRHRQVSLPLSPGSDYTLSLTLHSQPSNPISLYMDTGSDLVWFPCHPFECILCESKPPSTNPPPNITATAATLSCHSPACSAAHSSSSLSSSDLCAIARCPLESIETSDCSSFSCPPFYYAYGDGSLIASLYKDSLSIPMSSPSLILHNFTFGCAHTALAEPIGVAGFGRGVLSLPAQLASVSPQLGNQFSYCFVSHSFESDRVLKPSPLILGRYDEKERKLNDQVEFVYTEMLDNPLHPYFYSVGLEGISVGKKKIPAPEILKRVDREGSGGVVVDSGTTFTMLPARFYDSVMTEFENQMGKVSQRASDIESKTGLGPCYYFDSKVVRIPTLTLRFVGKGSSVVLPRKNYFYEFFDGRDGAAEQRRVGCMMLMNGGDEAELSGGPGAILGNYQQQGFEIVYDLEKRRVGFARRQCASLWESLNQG